MCTKKHLNDRCAHIAVSNDGAVIGCMAGKTVEMFRLRDPDEIKKKTRKRSRGKPRKSQEKALEHEDPSDNSGVNETVDQGAGDDDDQEMDEEDEEDEEKKHQCREHVWRTS